MASFEELPLEIQEEIVRQNPRMAPTLSRIRPFHAASQNVLCQQPPTKWEIETYLREFPNIVGTFWLSGSYFKTYHLLGNDIYLRCPYFFQIRESLISPNRGIREFANIARQYGEVYQLYYTPSDCNSEWKIDRDALCPSIEMIQSVNEDLTKEDNEPHRNIGPAFEALPDILKSPQLDLVSVYHILKLRLNCVTRQPDFAQREVLRRLHQVYQAYQQDPNIISLFATHAWLFLQTRVLNVYPSIQVQPIEDWMFTRSGEPVYVPYETDDPEPEKQEMREQLETLRREITTMYNQVRQALENL